MGDRSKRQRQMDNKCTARPIAVDNLEESFSTKSV